MAQFPRLLSRLGAAVAALAVCTSPVSPAAACPFCTALGPTLAQQRAAASVVALAALIAPDDPASGSRLIVHQVFKGADRVPTGAMLPLDEPTSAAPGTLFLLFGTTGHDADGPLAWQRLAVNEISYAYFARSPQPRTPRVERLRYFARYLEHPDPLIAEDAYQEFGHAPFDAVEAVAEHLSSDALRQWLTDERVPQARKGFYAMALGLEADPRQRALNRALLRDIVLTPQIDFRAGFDGAVGGYLLLDGQPALALVEEHLLANPDAPLGDVRHALTALRFYHEFGRAIPREQLHAAAARLLDRPEMAAAVVVDLARWHAWNQWPRVVALWDSPGYEDRAIQRAVIGFLLHCPLDEARAALAALRRRCPERVEAAERSLQLPQVTQ